MIGPKIEVSSSTNDRWNGNLGPVSRKSRNFTGHLRVSQFPFYLKNGEDLSRQTSQSVCFLLAWKHVKRSAFQNKRLAVLQMAFRARKGFGTFEKWAPVATSSSFAFTRAYHWLPLITLRFDWFIWSYVCALIGQNDCFCSYGKEICECFKT